MEFRVEKINGRLVAICEDKEKFLLSKVLLPYKAFIIDLLHSISWAEKKLYEKHDCENLVVSVGMLLDSITVGPRALDDEVRVSYLELPLADAKLLLFEWGAILQRWQREQKQ
jgi:hypothetical protein